MSKIKEYFFDEITGQTSTINHYFELITEEEYENTIRAKYGNSITGTLKMASGETSMCYGEEYLHNVSVTIPSLQDLDNLFTIDEWADYEE